MHFPKLRPPVIKTRDERFTSVIRWGLLVWAILRLIVSVLLTGTLIVGLIETIGLLQNRGLKTTSPNYEYYINHLLFFVYAILVYLVEIGMLVTFITAGIKKKVKLYRAYYHYCILTLIIYILSMIVCIILSYFGYVNQFIRVYVTYHIDDWPIIGDAVQFDNAFTLAAIFDVGLEIFLIVSIKKLIQAYSFTPPVNV